MWDEDGNWIGGEDFATVGYNYDDVGAQPPPPGGGGRAPGGQRRPGGRQPPPPGAYQRPQTLPVSRPVSAQQQQYPLAPYQPGPQQYAASRAAAGLNETRVRQIVDEHIGARLPAWMSQASLVPGSGTPDSGELLSPLGLTTGTLTTAVGFIVVSASPQRPFRGERLVVSIVRSAGAVGVPVRITEFKIGENSQLVGSGAVPAETFAPDAFGIRLAMSPATPGVIIGIRFEAGIPVPGGETILITTSIIGRAVWSATG